MADNVERSSRDLFQTLTVTVISTATSCSMVDIHAYVSEAPATQFSKSSKLKIKTVRSSETSMNINGIALCHIPQDGDLRSHRCENLKPRTQRRYLT
jgi:hypothetical protein